MATPYQMHIVPDDTGLWKFPQTDAAAKKATELLQRDLKDHHVFFNKDGFHNHIVHHILALYGTGAGAAALQKGYDDNASYQRETLPADQGISGDDLRDWSRAKKYLGRERHYPDFLAFFQREIERVGWRDVLNEYVFKPDDERADDMLVRLLSGFVHPLIQLMYGVEFAQPAIVAQGLAQACVHGDDIRGFLLESEALARRNAAAAAASDQRMPAIMSLYEAAAKDGAIASSVRDEDGNKLTKGVLVRARDEMIALAGRVKVAPYELEERTVEMFNACVFTAASAAANPKKHVKFDFFLMHHVNVAPIFLAINAAPWISTEAKVRILEWKIRLDLAQYGARAVPPLSIDRIASYRPRDEDGSEPIDVVSRLHTFEDDGHAIKLGRATGICRQVSEPYEDRNWMRLKGRENWMKVFHMIVDSVQGPGQHWVRTTGLDAAWKDIADAPAQ